MATRHRPNTLALTGIVAPAWFTTMVVVQAALQPGYSHVTMPISALAAWPKGWLQNLTFLVAGGLVVAFVVALHRVAVWFAWIIVVALRIGVRQARVGD